MINEYLKFILFAIVLSAFNVKVFDMSLNESVNLSMLSIAIVSVIELNYHVKRILKQLRELDILD
jgi:hypothetical protein